MLCLISVNGHLFLDLFFFFFNQKTAYEMRISDWSSDVCSSDLEGFGRVEQLLQGIDAQHARPREDSIVDSIGAGQGPGVGSRGTGALRMPAALDDDDRLAAGGNARRRHELAGVGDRLDRKSTRLNSSH